jgi:hypothetical protein
MSEEVDQDNDRDVKNLTLLNQGTLRMSHSKICILHWLYDHQYITTALIIINIAYSSALPMASFEINYIFMLMDHR